MKVILNVTWIKLIEDLLGFKWPIILADTRVIPPNNKVRDSIILSNQSVKKSLPRSRITHCGRKGRENHSILRIIFFKKHFVSLNSNVGWNIPFFGLTYERAKAQILADDIAHKLKEETEFPGQIRITVIREYRAIDFAK